MPKNASRGERGTDPVTKELAEKIREARDRSGPNATFEERRDLAVTIAAEALAELAADLEPKTEG